MEEKLLELLKTIYGLKSSNHSELINALDESLLFRHDDDKMETMDFAKQKKLIEFINSDNNPRSTPQYKLTVKGIDYLNKQLTEGEKIHKILGTIIASDRDCMRTTEIAKNTGFTLALCNALCAKLKANGDLEEMPNDACLRVGAMDVLKIRATNNAFELKTYLPSSTEPIKLIGETPIVNYYNAPVSNIVGNNNQMAGRDIKVNKPDKTSLDVAKKSVWYAKWQIICAIISIVLSLTACVLQYYKIWPFH